MNWINIIIVVLFFYTIIGYIKFRKFINPIIIFNVVWLICFILYNLNLSYFYSNQINLIITIYFILIFTLFNLCFYFSFYKKNIKTKHLSIKVIVAKNKKTYIIKVFKIWLVLTILEILYCKGFPLLWLLIGNGLSYASYGIPSIHGFINSLSWFVLLIAFMYYLDTRDKSILKIIILINVVYVLLLARQSIMTEIIQLTVIYAFKNKLQLKKIIFISIFTIIIFGIVGNIRTDLNHLLLTSGLKIKQVSFILSGFIWVYMYLMSPLANLINVFKYYNTFNLGLASVVAILPTAIVRILNLPLVDTSLFLVSETYNVSTGFLTPYVDFGILGVLLFVAFLGLYGGTLYKKLIVNKSFEINLCNYSVYIGILALTFFSNMLLSLPIITQFFYINILFRNYFNLNN